ncbi:hypothetical protein PAXINDRAFT_15480 [Paxillus involutus ATCC 200175]|uniref:Uncharacterized protein n=1 Tax=Paxillus involutus ATCC 200175 TaxID=664439 RepID=A0A0C9ST05_PAXIN|nr:hypothetical protein PAXINDRAFT_15480 [Paxillus involutus ATCC 200175]
MFRNYQLRATSGSALAPPGSRTPVSSTQWTTSSSSSRNSRASTPSQGPATNMVRSASSAAASSSLILQPPSSSVQSIWATPSNIPQAVHQCSTSDSSSSLDKPIHAGVCRSQDDNSENDLTQLSPQYIKQLKLFAKQCCNTLEIPEKAVLEFIDTGNLFYMLVDMKATMTKYEFTQQANQFQGLQDTVRSKDFEVALQNRLLACMLSLNITSYVTEAQHHIMEFISEHPDVFKVPAAVFEDAELRSQLGKLVTKLLSTIHSQIRSQLTISIAKKTCIIDMMKALVRGSSGLEVEATHWNRMEFLRRYLRIFLIGTDLYRTAKLQLCSCFTPRLIPMLKVDMCRELSVDMHTVEQELMRADGGDNVDAAAAADTQEEAGSAPRSPALPLAGRRVLSSNSEFGGDTGDSVDANVDTNTNTTADADADSGVPDIEESSEDLEDLDDNDSGFGLDGKPLQFNGTKF